jgi:hypothetical protein
MNAAEKVLAQLGHLRDHGSIARSQCSAALSRTLRPLLVAEIVVEKPSGAGRRLVVQDRAAFSEFCRQRFPGAEVPAETASRIAGVARFRNSKSMSNDLPEIVCVRSRSAPVLRRNGEPLDVENATRLHGVFSFSLGADPVYSLHGPCALVENPAVFFTIEKLGAPVELAIHARGRFSRRLLNWLAAQQDERFQLWHFPDYDPTGLDEFCRLRARLDERAKLFIPAQLPELFGRFSRRELLENDPARALLARLRKSDVPEVREVVALLDRHNAGLEQEALLLSGVGV